jgi:hypothetical protein
MATVSHLDGGRSASSTERLLSMIDHGLELGEELSAQ